jgi:hypothetical protein
MYYNYIVLTIHLPCSWGYTCFAFFVQYAEVGTWNKSSVIQNHLTVANFIQAKDHLSMKHQYIHSSMLALHSNLAKFLVLYVVSSHV